jgi:hypothetical protein
MSGYILRQTYVAKAQSAMNPLYVPETNTTPMELQTLKDLYLQELKDLFSAEQQLVKALPKMAKSAINVAAVASSKSGPVVDNVS